MRSERYAADGVIEALTTLAARFPGEFGREPQLRTEIEQARDHLVDPVRLAVAGFIKTGKSTLINALLRREIAVAGTLETTFRVYELRYGDAERIEVIFGDEHGRSSVERMDLARLRHLSVRDGGDLERLRRISRIVVTLDNAFLRDVRLIDTPGLGSVYGEDSAQTELLLDGRLDPATGRMLRRLGLTVDQVDQVSLRETRRADAVLYVIRDRPGRHDVDAVRRFLDDDPQARAAGPLRTFGILSRCDEVGEPMDLDFNPIEQYARRTIDSLPPEVRRLFHMILPVAGLVAEGAARLDEERVADLGELARMPPEWMVDQVAEPAVWRRGAVADAPIEAERQVRLMTELGPWGLLLAYKYVRAGCDMSTVRENLDRDSGVAAVRACVVEHFGRHAYLVNLDGGRAAIREQAVLFRRSLSAATLERDHERLDALEETLDRIEQSETGFAELRVRRADHAGQLRLSAEERVRMLRLTGASGRSCAARLGCTDGGDLSELERLAGQEVAYWQLRVNDAKYDAATQDAMTTLYDLAEDAARRVRKAHQLLSWHVEVRP